MFTNKKTSFIEEEFFSYFDGFSQYGLVEKTCMNHDFDSRKNAYSIKCCEWTGIKPASPLWTMWSTYWLIVQAFHHVTNVGRSKHVQLDNNGTPVQVDINLKRVQIATTCLLNIKCTKSLMMLCSLFIHLFYLFIYRLVCCVQLVTPCLSDIKDTHALLIDLCDLFYSCDLYKLKSASSVW